MSRVVLSAGLAALAALAALAPAAAETPAAASRARVEFAAGRIVIETTVAAAAFDDPRARYRAERQTAETLPLLFLSHASSLVVDSWDSLGSVAVGSPAVVAALSDLARRGRLEGSAMDEELRSARLVWSFPLFGPGGLAAALTTHGSPWPLPRRLADVLTTRYSGLVIYAAEPVPSHGTPHERLPRPALFPRIYDQAMNLVLEKGMCEPASLARWGMVAYTDNPADSGPAARIGSNPLRVLARGVFGRNDTDLLIPTDAARRLLATADNRRLLREGRILIVYRDVSPPLLPAAADAAP